MAGVAGLGLAPLASAGASSPSDPLPGAVQASTTAGSEHFTMSLKFAATGLAATGLAATGLAATGLGGASRGLAVTANGVLDNAIGTPHGVGQAPGTPEALVHLHVADLGTVDLRLLGGVLYVHLPAVLATRIPGVTHPWLAANLAALRQVLGAGATTSTGYATMPTNVLAALSQVSTSVSKVGTATLRGVATTEYVANLQVSKLAAIDPALGATQLAELEMAVPNGTIPVSVWVDAAGQVHQVHLRLVIPVSAAAAVRGATAGTGGPPGAGSATTAGGAPTKAATGTTGEVSISFTMDLFDYGPPTVFSTPPTSQVQDVTKQLETLLAKGGGSPIGPTAGTAGTGTTGLPAGTGKGTSSTGG